MTASVPVPPTRPTVSWYIQTAGVKPGQDYTWLAVDQTDDPMYATVIVAGDVAERPLLDLVSERTPSVLLARRADGRHVLYANNLRPAGAPADGDYMRRPIRATLLGVAAAQEDAAMPLLDAAAAALSKSLADRLPLTWTEAGPAIVPSDTPWTPPASDRDPDAATRTDLQESIAVPVADQESVAKEITALHTHDLNDFPPDRPLLLATDMFDPEELATIRPWRALTPAVSTRKSLTKEGKRRPSKPVIVAVAAIGVALVKWFVVSRLFGRS